MEKMRTVLIGMVLAAAQLVSAPVSAVVHTYQNEATGWCLDDSEWGLRTVYDCHGDPHQQWEIIEVLYDDTEIRILQNRYTGRCIDDSEVGLRTYDCHYESSNEDDPHQLWRVQRWRDGTLRYENVYTGKCMIDHYDGGLYTVKPCDDSEAQSWK